MTYWNFSYLDAFYYLCLYKDDVHAKEEKEKYVLPLKDFCGLESLKHYDKTKNVLVLITAKQTAFLSFEDAHLRDQWFRILVDHFGEGMYELKYDYMYAKFDLNFSEL